MSERATIREQIVWEFAGEYPEVPTIDGVDMETLTRGDSEPFFVTLPIGKAGVVSGNNTYYDDAFQRELVQQVHAKRPTGLMGHIPDYERSNAFPLPAVHWVGAIQQAGMTWGKGYIPPGEVREFVRRLKATGAKIATSIYGTANREWNEALSAWVLREFELETIDLAPPERAGIRDLAVTPKITAEMSGDVPRNDEEDEMDREQVIRELTAEDARLLPDVVVAAIRAELPETTVVSELRRTLDLEDGADVLQAVRALSEQVKAQQQAAIENRIAELAREHIKVDDDAGSVRALVVELVRAEHPADASAVDAVFQSVLERQHVKSVLQMVALAEMGPAHRSPVGQRASKDGENPFVSIPKAE